MKNKIYLCMSLSILALAAPQKAEAGFLGCFFLGIGCDAASTTPIAPRPVASSCSQDDRGMYHCNPASFQRASPAQIQQAKHAHRTSPAFIEPADERRGCRSVGHCTECPGPQHDMGWRSPRGYAIRLSNAGQNHLSQSIRQVLNQMADDKGHGIQVTSGYRSCARNGRVGGAKSSQHLRGNAADFYFMGSSDKKQALASFARKTLAKMGRGGGTGSYACSNPAHVDTGRQRQWNWGTCGNRRIRGKR